MSPKFGPKTAANAARDAEKGLKCPGCSKPFEEGDMTTLVSIGPGDDEDARQRCSEGRPYNGVAIEAHYACVTGMLE